MKYLLRLTVLLVMFLVTNPAAWAQDDIVDINDVEDVDVGADADLSEPALTSHESCRRSCERDFAICGDEGASARATLEGRPSATQLSRLRCKNNLTACLKGCKGL